MVRRVADQEDLFATNLRTGCIRRVTSCRGGEFPLTLLTETPGFVHVQMTEYFV
jgi:hypothetical protein